jgi:hypothetical protein
VCISPVMSNFEQTASIAGLMFPGETCMRPYGPCPLISLRIPRPRGLLALILINWVLWAAQPIVMLCRWRYPRVTSWIVDAFLDFPILDNAQPQPSVKDSDSGPG